MIFIKNLRFYNRYETLNEILDPLNMFCQKMSSKQKANNNSYKINKFWNLPKLRKPYEDALHLIVECLIPWNVEYWFQLIFFFHILLFCVNLLTVLIEYSFTEHLPLDFTTLWFKFSFFWRSLYFLHCPVLNKSKKVLFALVDLWSVDCQVVKWKLENYLQHVSSDRIIRRNRTPREFPQGT